MTRQFLNRPASLDTATVVRRLGGVQSQVSSSAEQAIAMRRADATGDIAQAIHDRSVVKTWAMRGTLHLLATDHAADYLSLLAAARTWDKPSWQRAFATAKQMLAIADAARVELHGFVLTREELGAVIVSRTGDRALGEKLASGWGALLKPLAWQGLLCNAVSRDKQVTFTSPATWLPG